MVHVDPSNNKLVCQINIVLKKNLQIHCVLHITQNC